MHQSPEKNHLIILNSPPKKMFCRKEEKYRNLLTIGVSFKKHLGQPAVILTTGFPRLNQGTFKPSSEPLISVTSSPSALPRIKITRCILLPVANSMLSSRRSKQRLGQRLKGRVDNHNYSSCHTPACLQLWIWATVVLGDAGSTDGPFSLGFSGTLG